MVTNQIKTQNALLEKIPNFFGQIFKITLLAIIIAEGCSVIAYSFPWFNKAGFILAIILVIILAWKKLEWGLYIILIDLFIASKGYLFYWEIEENKISVRLAIFLTLFLIWLTKAIKHKDLSLKKTNLFWPFIIFITVLIGGIILGYLKNNNLSNIFFDVNGYLYFGLIFAFFMVIKNKETIFRIIQVFFASLLALGIKTLILLYLFSHKMFELTYLYRWIRLTGVGEITLYKNNFYRIFFQSHIYFLFAFLILTIILIIYRNRLKNKSRYALYFLLFISTSVLFLSYSRSFWLGWIVALILLFIWLFLYQKIKIKKIIKYLGIFIFFCLISISFIWLIVNFPWPNPNRLITFSSLIEERTELKGEAAAGSRFALLKPLGNKILQSPIIGSGFGTTITYKSQDPRALEKDPTGLYTHYIFEWGYLDTVSEIGLVGLLVYLFFLFLIFWQGYKTKIKNYALRVRNFKVLDFVQIATFLSLIVLITVHITTPYLNHPLGIGWLMLVAAVLNINSTIFYEQS